MSQKEFIRRKIAREVMRSAWIMFKNHLISWRTCLRITWKTVRFKADFRYTKVRGTTFGDRQDTLRKLSFFESKNIGLRLLRKSNNPYDPNAILVLASVQGIDERDCGYLSKEISAWMSPHMDQGREAIALFSEVTGVNRQDGYLGMNIKFVLL